MSGLLDTCPLSGYAKKAPASQVIAWLDEQDEASLYLSVITIGEIGKGILKLRATNPRRSQKLTAWLGEVERSCSDLANTRVARRSKSTSGTSADEEKDGCANCWAGWFLPAAIKKRRGVLRYTQSGEFTY